MGRLQPVGSHPPPPAAFSPSTNISFRVTGRYPNDQPHLSKLSRHPNPPADQHPGAATDYRLGDDPLALLLPGLGTYRTRFRMDARSARGPIAAAGSKIYERTGHPPPLYRWPLPPCPSSRDAVCRLIPHEPARRYRQRRSPCRWTQHNHVVWRRRPPSACAAVSPPRQAPRSAPSESAPWARIVPTIASAFGSLLMSSCSSVPW